MGNSIRLLIIGILLMISSELMDRLFLYPNPFIQILTFLLMIIFTFYLFLKIMDSYLHTRRTDPNYAGHKLLDRLLEKWFLNRKSK